MTNCYNISNQIGDLKCSLLWGAQPPSEHRISNNRGSLPSSRKYYPCTFLDTNVVGLKIGARAFNFLTDMGTQNLIFLQFFFQKREIRIPKFCTPIFGKTFRQLPFPCTALLSRSLFLGSNLKTIFCQNLSGWFMGRLSTQSKISSNHPCITFLS